MARGAAHPAHRRTSEAGTHHAPDDSSAATYSADRRALHGILTLMIDL
jgi:hypothetical protein